MSLDEMIFWAEIQHCFTEVELYFIELDDIFDFVSIDYKINRLLNGKK